MNKKKESWLEIFRNHKCVYIYGAKTNAMKLFRLAEQTGVSHQVAGFAVTSKDGNPEILAEHHVEEAKVIRENNCVFLVPQLGLEKKEIAEYLEHLQKNYIYAAQYVNLCDELEKEYPADEMWEKAVRQTEVIRQGKTEHVLRTDEQICRQIKDDLAEIDADFSGDDEDPYQSLELIGLNGQRQTLYRIYRYGLQSILAKNQQVLNIGSNTGFIDMTIAGWVKQITGIEYDKNLINIANKVKEYLEINNINFYNDDFSHWYHENENQKYDVVFSLAVHHWLNVESEQYVKMIDHLLNKEGVVVFESHAYDLVNEYGSKDMQWEECVELFWGKGYTILNDGSIKDDGVISRKFCVLKKQAEL